MTSLASADDEILPIEYITSRGPRRPTSYRTSILTKEGQVGLDTYNFSVGRLIRQFRNSLVIYTHIPVEEL